MDFGYHSLQDVNEFSPNAKIRSGQEALRYLHPLLPSSVS